MKKVTFKYGNETSIEEVFYLKGSKFINASEDVVIDPEDMNYAYSALDGSIRYRITEINGGKQ